SGCDVTAGEPRCALIGTDAEIHLTETVAARRDFDSGEYFKGFVQTLEAAVELKTDRLAALPVHAVVVVPLCGLEMIRPQRVPPVPLEMRIDTANMFDFGIERTAITKTWAAVVVALK